MDGISELTEVDDAWLLNERLRANRKQTWEYTTYRIAIGPLSEHLKALEISEGDINQEDAGQVNSSP